MRRILRAAVQWPRTLSQKINIPGRPLVVFALAFAAFEILEAHFRRYAIEGIYFQGLTSETLMQSVSLRELRAAPLQSLWYLHIQPPLFNLLRAVLVAFHRGTSWDAVMRGVDRDLNHAWALTGAALASLVDAWFRRLKVPGALAALLTLGWLLHPANVYYVTLLDSTLPSALLTTWIVYETWRLGSAADGGSVGRLSAAVLLAYFTRSIFQWPFVVVMLASLCLLRVSRRRLLVFGSVVGLVVGLYSIKQAYLFGTVSTSTFQGMNLVRSIGADCGPGEPQVAPARGRLTAPVLTEPLKLDNSVNFNQWDRLAVERGLMTCFRQTVARHSLRWLWANYATNFGIFILPSSSYSANRLVDRLPWRGPFDWMFSGWFVVGLAVSAGAVAVWQARRRWRASVAVLLPVAYVLVASVAGERGENERFKFFLEPALYVLVATQLYRVARQALGAAKRLAIRRSQAELPKAEVHKNQRAESASRPFVRNARAGDEEEV